MRTLVCLLAFLGSANSLLAADSFAGTWKMNVAKSKSPVPVPPGMAVKEQTVVVHETSEQWEVTVNSTQENGSVISLRYSHPLEGGPVTFSEGAPPAGISATMKKINDRTVDFIITRDGKVVVTNHRTVSADGKTLRVDIEGVDAQGKPVQGLEVFDKQ